MIGKILDFLKKRFSKPPAIPDCVPHGEAKPIKISQEFIDALRQHGAREELIQAMEKHNEKF